VTAVHLTPREREIIQLIAAGHATKAIAAQCGLSIHTVKHHVRSVMGKLGLHTRLRLAAHWRQTGNGGAHPRVRDRGDAMLTGEP